jgi:hypothetical protein
MCLQMIKCCTMPSLSFAEFCDVLLLVANPAITALHYLIRHYVNIDFNPLQSQLIVDE